MDKYLLGGSIDLIESSQKIFGLWGCLPLGTKGHPKDPKLSYLEVLLYTRGRPSDLKIFLGASHQVNRPS